mmetsp:Transcript_17764/g.41776  ORF Transcript_17764/g.41776 Transcript_17764/m.41776 type:complete len:1379 (+) Transcript_17764:96-4232(+)|eukprot:CAMPEP_0114546950 /NCGR_PEP_ID=MMETSP0114-20121206/4204_1 /TAXON_ID=31324 /ORGANISM="Goniomonas sp, Strain m" /LENGTH=1378 /DNA_ID=CAMNT_0001731473 /DNA_START=59 /DNA_END=4195 /DNA_ORIENTATION=-
MASLFFDYTCAPPKESAGAQTLCTAWSPRATKPILAVGSSNGQVNLYEEEGEPVDTKPQLRRGVPPCVMAWGPAPNYYLAVGWSDGAVSLWDETNRVQRDDSAIHNTQLNFMIWSPDGNRIITGDVTGIVGVWKPDARGHITPVLQHRRDGPAVHCTFRLPTNPINEEGASQCPMFYFGGESGVVCLADDMGRCRVVCEVKAPIAAFLYAPDKDRLVVITKNMNLATFQMTEDGKAVQIGSDVKLSATAPDAGLKLRATWAGPGLLATVCQESVVRMWNLDQDDNYVLSISDHDLSQAAPTDRIVCLDFNPVSGVLAAGTMDGRVVMWRCETAGGVASQAAWTPLMPSNLGQRVNSVNWAKGEGRLAVSLADSAMMLSESMLVRKVKCGYAAIQTGSETILLEPTEGKAEPYELVSQLRIKGADLTAEHMVLWSGKQAEVYEIIAVTGQLKQLSSFACKAHCIAIEGQHLYMTVDSRLGIANLHGTVGNTVSFNSASEGVPLLLDSFGTFLAAFTSESIIKVWDISRRDPKPVVAGRKFDESENKVRDAVSIRVNATGMRVSLLCKRREAGGMNWVRDSRVYVLDAESDLFSAFDFAQQHRYPASHSWDPIDHRLLCLQTHALKTVATSGEFELSVNPVEVTSMFATPDMGLKIQDSFPIAGPAECLLGVHVPHIFLATPKGRSLRLNKRVLRDFVGMEANGKLDDATRNALLDFSYKLTIGNMDEAYRAVKLVKSSSVWKNMALMCVKTKRLDVAEVCLGNMAHARGARAVRLSKHEPEIEARVAMVALQLGMREDAERLYHECGRYDLLNNFYQATAQWGKAVEVAEKKDRMHLRATHYNEARYHESVGDVNAAMKSYEAAGAHRTEVPRLLVEHRLIDQLEQYVNTRDDPELYKWWAHYCESEQNLDKALGLYEKAGDNLSLVRVHCFRGEFDQAVKRVESSQDAVASYHLASQFEIHGRVQEAVKYFAQSGRFNHAARLAKENGMQNELLALALQSPVRVMLETAQFFEGKNMMDQAVLLYQKAGNISKALDLCFRAKLFDSLRAMADGLGSDTDPALLAMVGDFFLANKQYDKAVQLLITGRHFDRALELCLEHDVKVDEDTAERITEALPTKEEGEADRNRILHKIAKVAKKQGSFHLATKKFTQAGMKMKAMKALLRSGDTEKIIFFAGVLKQPDIFVMAANYLQTLDWHNDPEIMKAIQNFYTKAKAFFSLATFFEACSQVEIDEYRDYEKALGALKEGLKFCQKAKNVEATHKAQDLETRIKYVEAFVAGRKLAMSDPNEMIQVCYQLLQQPDIESAIRVGDVFALLIEWYYTQGNYQQAYQLTEKMRERHIILGPYLDQMMVEKIYSAMGIDTGNEDGGVDEEIAEDI